VKSIRLLRHAESAANAGLPTSDPGEIPLTAHGRAAAESAAREYDGPAPKLIVVSPFLRARQTAEPFIMRFPAATVETTWPVQEFTYISPQRCLQTTFEDRRPLVEGYWSKASPGYVDGPGAESFGGFIARVRESLAKLKEREEETILVVCHEMFMQAAKFYDQPGENPHDADSLRRFFNYKRMDPVPNLGWRDLPGLPPEPPTSR